MSLPRPLTHSHPFSPARPPSMQLLSLGGRKSFLREAASGAVLEVLRALGPSGASRVLAACDELRAFISVAHREATPEVCGGAEVEGGGGRQ